MAENPFTESRKRGERLGQCERFCAGVDLTPAMEAGVTLGDALSDARNCALNGKRCAELMATLSLFQKDSSNG